jgi:thiol-disulfide isomerase/thioredoxin
MRISIFIMFGLMAAMGTGRAEEKLPQLQAGSQVYSNVTVTTVTPTDIYFTHAGGMGNAKLKQLSPELQKHFGYDAKQAGEAEQKRAAANAQYRSQAANQPPPRPQAGKDATPSAPTKPTSGLSWGTDLPAALNQAQSENKLVLLDFTGSDWCGWCIKFDRDVLSTPGFAAYAQNKLVLVVVDFPRQKPQSDALKQANNQLKDRFRVDGFPTFVLLNHAGKELGRQVGYARGGPDAFIAELEGFSKR